MNERIIDRVRKMLALSRDKGATEGERDNALRMAHATVAKYNLDMAAIEAARPPGSRSQPEEKRDFYSATFFGRPWARIVAGACAELFFCEYLYMAAKKGKDTKHLFVGRESNALTAASMAEWLVDSIMREGKRYQHALGEGNAAYRSFATGAGVRIHERVAELRKASESLTTTALIEQSKEPGAGTALVLRSLYVTEASANKALVQQRFPVLGKGKSGKGVEIGAALAGREYGDKVSLNRQIR